MARKYKRLLPGQVFGRLTVLEETPAPTEYTEYKGLWYRCRCQCGNETVVRRSSLVSGATRSCGCLRRENSLTMRRCSSWSPSRAAMLAACAMELGLLVAWD